MSLAGKVNCRYSIIASAGSDGVRLWDTASGKLLDRLQGHQNPWGVGFSPDNKWLVAEDSQGLHLWNVAARKKHYHIKGLFCCFIFSNDSQVLISGNNDGTIAFWELATCQEIFRIRAHRAPIASLTISANGESLASGSSDTSILTWNLSTVWRHGLGILQNEIASDQFDNLWADLASPKSHSAYRAIWQFMGAQKILMPLLRQRLDSTKKEQAEIEMRIRRLISELDSDKFSVRDRASQQLATLGRSAELALRRVLETQASPEVRRRAVDILNALRREEALGTRPLDLLRLSRVIQGLECLATAEAQLLLQSFATDLLQKKTALEAKAALQRLEMNQRRSEP